MKIVQPAELVATLEKATIAASSARNLELRRERSMAAPIGRSDWCCVNVGDSGRQYSFEEFVLGSGGVEAYVGEAL